MKASTFLKALFLAITFLGAEAIAQKNPAPAWGLDVPRGTTVVLKIPNKLLGFERVSTWSGAVSYGAVIEQSQKGGYLIGGLNDWRVAGWTMMRQVVLEKVTRDKNFLEVEFRDPLFNIKLRFANGIPDINAAFRDVAFLGTVAEFEASDYYKQEVIAKLLPAVFTGKLASIPVQRKMDMLKELKYIDSAIATESYKGAEYLSINVGGDTEVYNSNRVDQPTRIAHSLNQRVLYYFKRIARIIRFHPDVDGIKITILVPYKDFITAYYSTPYYDRLEVYAPMDTIRQFVDNELTNQEFAEESILLVNGNRIQAPPVKSL